jgi:hypothetical protein
MQHFLLFLIAHFQKAALLMFSDRLVEALRAGRQRPDKRARFKREIRSASRASCASRTATGSTRSASRRRARPCSACCSTIWTWTPLYAEVKTRIADMNSTSTPTTCAARPTPWCG